MQKTMTAAHVIAGNEFVPGQLYVACSRVSTKEGLKLSGFNLDKLIPPPEEVKVFFSSLKDPVQLCAAKSCCFSSNVFSPEISSLLFNVNWDADILLTNDSNSLVPVEVDDESDNSDNDDDILVNDVDFDMILATLVDPQDLPLFPENFVVEQFCQNLLIDCDVGIDSNIKSNEERLYESLHSNPQYLSFLKVQWHNITSSFNVKENGKYERKELTDFCSDLFVLSTSNSLLSDFSSLISVPVECLKTEHYTVCTDIIFGLGNIFLQVLSSRFTADVTAPFMDVGEISPDKLGKVRYVMGWCLRKMIENSQRYLHDNILSKTDEVRKNIKVHVVKIKILETMIQSYCTLQQQSEYKKSLEITFQKQNRTHGLLNVSDLCFMFGISLEKKRVNLLNEALLKKLKGDLIDDSLTSVLEDKDLFEEWKSLCQNLIQSIQSSQSEEIFDLCISNLHAEIIKKYFKMGTSEYLRDYRRDMKWSKSEARRKKVLMRAAKKELLSGQVKLNDIKEDKSTNKINSHVNIKAMIQKHPSIFETRVYTIRDIETLLKAYGVNKKGGKKSLLASRLVEAINANDSMVDDSVFI